MSHWLLPGPVDSIQGAVAAPTSKSLTNRALIAAATAGGGHIEAPLDCEDTRLLAGALKGCGWRVDWDAGIIVGDRRVPAAVAEVNLGNSGTGARLLMSLVAASPGAVVVDGCRRLRERPFAPLVSALRNLGAELECAPGDHLPVRVQGRRLRGGACALAPGVSSQFVSSLLMAAPLMESGLDLTLIGEVPSRPYLDLTVQVLRAFGGEVSRIEEGRRWRIAPGQLTPTCVRVEGDWSAAAFMAAAVAAVGGTLHVGGLDCQSRQGDRAILDILGRGGLSWRREGDGVRLEGVVEADVTAELKDTPDLFPALAVVAAAARPGSRLYGLDHLRHKESNRLSVMIENLEKLGARFRFDQTSLEVTSSLHRQSHCDLVLTAAGDHRIAMALAVAALIAGPFMIDNTECVGKSFPGFWPVWAQIAGALPTDVPALIE